MSNVVEGCIMSDGTVITYRTHVFNNLWEEIMPAPETPVPAKLPELPAECWNENPIDGSRAFDALKAMCGG